MFGLLFGVIFHLNLGTSNCGTRQVHYWLFMYVYRERVRGSAIARHTMATESYHVIITTLY
jgi:hypothetical protein